MKKIKFAGLFVMLMGNCFLLALAEENISTQQAVSIPGIYLSNDSESFSTYKVGTGYYPFYEHGQKYSGVVYQYQYFSEHDWSATAQQISLVSKAINPRTGLGYEVNVGYNRGSDHGLVTTDSSYGGRLTDSTTFALLLSRDRVETKNSIMNGIHSTFIGGSVEQQIVDRFSAVALVGNMYFSDSNTRTLFRTRLIYDLVPEAGITAQLRYRQFRNSHTTGPRYYFNPEKYNEWMLAFGMRKRVNGWMLNGVVGLGRQYIDQDSGTSTHLLEVGATSPIKENLFYLNTRIGYGNSANLQGPNYSYGYITGQFVVPF